MIPLAVLVAVALVLFAAVAAVWRQGPAERRTLSIILLTALALRLVAALALHASGAWQINDRGATTPDEATIDLAARLLASGHGASPLELGGSLHTAWLLVSWAFYDLVWNNLLMMKIVSTVFGALLVVPTYLLARRLHSVKAAVLAAWAMALFPTALVWSALGLRESMLALVLTTTVLLAVLQVGSPRARWAWIGGTAACLVVLSFTRSYMTPLLMVVVLVAGALQALRHHAAQRFVVAAVACALAVAVVWFLPTGDQLVRTTMTLASSETVYNPLSGCERNADCRATPPPSTSVVPRNDRAAPEPTSEDSVAAPDDAPLEDSLQSISRKGVVRGVAIAVLAGRPVWETTDFFFLLQPGVVLWWTIIPATGVGAAAVAKRRDFAGVLATAGYAGAVLAFLAYSGQFIRHHFMLEPVAIALAAIGVRALWDDARWGTLRLVTAIATAVMLAAALASVAHSLIA